MQNLHEILNRPGRRQGLDPTTSAFPQNPPQENDPDRKRVENL